MATLHTIDIEAGELTYDSSLTVGQVKRMSNAEGSIEAVIEVLAEVVTDWPFEGDPSEEASWDDLTIPEFSEVATAITEGLGKELG